MSESRPRLGLSAAATWFLTMRLDSEAMKATAGMGSGLVWWSPFVMLLLVLAFGLSYLMWRRRAKLILARRRARIPR